MSYKAFKEYFQSCRVRRCSGTEPLSSHGLTSSAADGGDRKPPKTSFKNKIASWEFAGDESLHVSRNIYAASTARPDSSAASLSALERVQEDDGVGSKRLFDESCTEVEQRAEVDTEEIDERMHESGALPLSSDLGVHMKRTTSAPCRRLTDVSRSTTSMSLPLRIKEEDEKDDGDAEVTEVVRLEDQEELGRDSEAGLFSQPEPEGPFEPLILWVPPGGVASSHAVGQERIVRVPPSINSRLLEHQRKGVLFLYDLYRDNRGGILGDDMGLGKTIQAIAFLAAILFKDPEPVETKLSVQKQSFEKVVLIICPTSVVHNWEQEFSAWGEFQIGIFHGLQREIVLARVQAKEVEIVLTSHDTFRIHGDELCKINWDCVIVDEAHRLKNDRSQLYSMCSKLPTKRRYGLTGTVMQNQYIELFNVFDWATPGCLGTRDHFREYYAGPIAQGQRISAPHRFVVIAEDRQKHLSIVLRSYWLRRTKKETIGHLMKGKEDNVIFCPMSSVQKSVYKRVLRSPDYQALINKSLPCSCGSPLTRAECCYRIVPNGVIWSYLHKDSLEDGCDLCPFCLVLPCLTKLRQLSNHLELIKPNPKDDLDKQNKDYKFALMAFGADADVVGGVHQEQSFLGLSDAQHCGKMSALEKLLVSWVMQGDKVLLFSDSVRMLDILEKFLIRKGYCFSRLDGSISMSTRQALVEDFNHSPSKQIFLISTKAGGLGLNLTSANRVVIFDPNWNPAHDLQAQDRSFRFGQNRHVTVFRLLAAGSLEELVYTRQIYKQQLFNIALTGVSEKRYFEGVQGSKQHKGELFGMSNLFRDISGDLFAEDIIENHEERLEQMQSKAALEEQKLSAELPFHLEGLQDAEEGSGHQGDLTCVEVDDSGGWQQLTMKEEDLGDTEELRTQRMVLKALTKAGVKYSHRNEDVVNLGPSAPEPAQANADHTSTLQSSSKKHQKIIKEKQTSRKKGKTLCQPKHIQLQNGASVVRNKESNLAIPVQPKRPTLWQDKKAMFAQLAKFKGMDNAEFSKWCLSATQQERTQLQSEYSEFLTRTWNTVSNT